MEKQIQEQTFLNQVYIPEGMNVLLDEIARVHRLVNGNQHRRKKSDILIQAFQRLGGMDYLQGELAAAQIALLSCSHCPRSCRLSLFCAPKWRMAWRTGQHPIMRQPRTPLCPCPATVASVLRSLRWQGRCRLFGRSFFR